MASSAGGLTTHPRADGSGNGRLPCPYRHGKAHSTGYETSVRPSGKVRLHQRT